MVVDELGNSFCRVAIAGYYGWARVALFVDLRKLPCVQSWTRVILVSHIVNNKIIESGW